MVGLQKLVLSRVSRLTARLLRSSGFYTKYINVIDFNTVFDPGGAPYVRAENLDDARIYGMEVSAMGRGSLFGVPLQLLSGYTYMQPELLNPSNLRLQTFGEDGKLRISVTSTHSNLIWNELDATVLASQQSTIVL